MHSTTPQTGPLSLLVGRATGSGVRSGVLTAERTPTHPHRVTPTPPPPATDAHGSSDHACGFSGVLAAEYGVGSLGCKGFR